MPVHSKPPRPLPRTPTATTTPSRPSKARAELEVLRQRGLTTLLNRHFTDATRQVAAEKAAADAALRDLEERRARTSEFQASRNGDLSPLDSLYCKVNQWRADTRRKERETLLLYQRYVHKFGNTGQVSVPTSTANGASVPEWARHASGPATRRPVTQAPLCSPTVPVSQRGLEIETALAAYLKQGGLELPSVAGLGGQTTFQQQFAQHEAAFKQYYLRQLEEKGVDVAARRSWEEEFAEFSHRINGPVKLNQSTIEEDNEFKDEGDVDRPLFFVNSDYEEDDDRSVVSGLTTLNSAETRRVLQDCEKSVATFLNEEHAAIRKMMLKKDGDEQTVISSSEETMMSTRAADQAESMVKQMQHILDDFKTGKTGTADGDADEEEHTKCRSIETKNPNEDWVAYYDEKLKREYFHERNTNRTQWESPSADNTSLSEADSYTFQEFSPEKSPSSQRYASYRRQQRRMRKRQKRRMVFGGLLILLVALLAVVAHYYRSPLQAWWCETVPAAGNYVQCVKPVVDKAPMDAIKKPLPVTKATTKDWMTKKKVVAPVVVSASQPTSTEVALDRPWFCNIPLLYLVHGECRQLSRRIDLQGLVTSMMQ